MEKQMALGRSVLLVALVAAAGAAQAAGAGLRIGTTGLGGDFGWDIAPTLGGRIGLSAGSWSNDFNTDDVQLRRQAEARQPERVPRLEPARAVPHLGGRDRQQQQGGPQRPVEGTDLSMHA